MTEDPPPLPRVELVLSRRSRLGGLAVACFVVAGSTALLQAIRHGPSAWWYTCATILAVVSLVALWAAITDLVRPPRIVLDEHGLTEVGPFRVLQRERWEDCVRFSPDGGGVGFQNRAFRTAPDERSRRRLRARRTGYPARLAAGYGGLDRDELCSLLNLYRETFTDRRRRDAPSG